MALVCRVIPCLDVADGRVVKGVNFENLRDMGDPVELAREYFRQGADELAFLDVTATVDERATTFDCSSDAASSHHLQRRILCWSAQSVESTVEVTRK